MTDPDATATAELAVRVAASRKEVEALRPAWEAMQFHPNADIDYFLTVVEAREEIERPHVIAVCEGDRPIALLIGRIEEDALEIKLGGKVLFRPWLRQLKMVYGGALGDWTEAVATAAIGEVMRLLAEGGVDLAFFNFLPKDSALFAAASSVPGFLQRGPPEPDSAHWSMTLRGSYEEFLQNLPRKKRQAWRRYARRFLQEFGDDVSLECFTDPADLDRIMADSDVVAAKSYHRAFDVGFKNDEDTRRRLKLSLEKGWLRSYLLYVRGAPIAFRHVNRYGETIFAFGTCYDPAYRRYGVGHYLLMRLIEDYSDDPSVGRIDFGFGDAEYKREICDRRWDEASVYILAPGPKGARIKLLRSSSSILAKWILGVLTRTNLYQRVKTRWRRRSAESRDEGG
jgi:hypothetical protein